MAYRIEVGERMRRTRLAIGKEQGALARELGEAENTWNQYEKGKRLIDPITLDRWCRLDRISMSWIYSGNLANLRYEIAKVVTAEEAPQQAPTPPSSARRAKQKAAK